MASRIKPVVEPGEGDSVALGGIGVDFKIPAEWTGGAFAVVEHPLDVGRLVPPHIHYREDELSYVIEGTVGVRIGDHEYLAGPGTYVWKPREVPHTFWNAGESPARLLEIIWPAGFEQFFARLAELAQQCAPDEFVERRAALAREYDHHFVHGEWVDGLKERYGLKLLGEA